MAGNQARATSVDLGLGPEPPVLYPRGPLPPITDYYHEQGYPAGGELSVEALAAQLMQVYSASRGLPVPP